MTRPRTTVLIVEDELKTLNGLISLILRFGEGYEVIATARNGLDGLEQCRLHQPDITVTDIRMPEMDGLEMAARLREQGYPGKVIVLSGHSDFGYARKALQVGIFDYVLKPITPNDFISVLDKAARSLERERRQSFSPDELPALFDRLSLLAFEDEPETLQRFDAHFEDPAQGAVFPLVLFFGGKLTSRDSALSLEALRLSFSGAERLYTSVVRGMYRIHVLPRYGALEEFRRGLDRCVERLAEIAAPVFAVYDDRISLPATDRFAELLPLSVWSLVFGAFSATSAAHIRSIAVRQLSYPHHLERAILQALYRRQDLSAPLDAFISALSESGCHPKDMYEAMAQLTNSVMYHLKSVSAQLYGEIAPMQVLSWVERCLTLDCYRSVMLNLFGRLSHSGGDGIPSASKITGLALDAIHRDYARDISLESVAGSLSVTPEYLSRKFGADVGKSFISYLNEYRVERAKELLAAGKRRVYEIAGLTGFANAKYFASVFRKYTGQSPRDYTQEASKSERL